MMHLACVNMKLYFVRHSHSEANLKNVFSNRDESLALTERGSHEAAALADDFVGKSIDRVFTSPLLRARETAAVLGEATGAPVEVRPELCEYDMGELEGRSDPESWALYWAISDDWLKHGSWHRKPPGGENLFEIRNRFLRFFDALRTEQSNASYVLVGHGGLYRCVLPFVLANVDFSFTVNNNLDHSEYVIAERRGASLVCTEWAGREVRQGEWLQNLTSTIDDAK